MAKKKALVLDELGDGLLLIDEIEKRLLLPPGSLRLPDLTLARYDGQSNPDFVPEVDPTYLMDPKQARAALVAMTMGSPVQAYGPTGSGKTSFWQQIAARLGREFRVIQCESKLSPKILLGKQEVVIEDRDGKSFSKTAFALGPVPLYIQRPGAIVLFDEYDTLGDGVGFCLQSLLNKENPVLRIPDLEDNGIFYPAVDVCLVATTNTVSGVDETGEYQRVMQDKSQVDRFLCKIPFPQPDPVKVLRLKTDGKLADSAVEALGTFFKQFTESPVLRSFTLSMRRLVYIAEWAIATGDVEDAMETVLFNELTPILQSDARNLAAHIGLLSPIKG